MFLAIQHYCDLLTQLFDNISEERKQLLQKISIYITQQNEKNIPIQLVYVCTHNSRRSHFGQIWAAVAANYYAIKNVYTFSGGTEATTFNINAITALQKIGFDIKTQDQITNPIYTIRFGENESIKCFSKVYNDAVNPSENFAAIMTCSDAEQNCPFIAGVDLRIGTTYNDPKAYDNTPKQDDAYAERLEQIALECLYVFSLVK
jgi:arsenate reductase